MKTMRVLLLIVALALIAAACGSDDDAAETTTTEAATTTTAAATTTTLAVPDLGGRTLTVAVENLYLPFNYIPLGGTEGEGWDYDTFRAICDLINCVPEFIQASWPALIDQVAAGEFDTAGDGISITEKRAEVVLFSEAYMVVEQRFIAQLDDDRWGDATEVITGDALVGTQVGTTNYELAVELVGEDRIQAFDQFPLAVQALINGDVDVVIIDDSAGQGYVGVNADELRTVDGALQSDPLGFIYELGSDLKDPIDLAVTLLKADGTWDVLHTKYFTDAFVKEYCSGDESLDIEDGC